MALATDEAGIQFRILNSQQRPGRCAHPRPGRPHPVQGRHPPAPGNQPNLWLFQQAVDDLVVEGRPGGGAVRRWASRSAPPPWC